MAVYHVQGTSEPLHVIEKLHSKPVSVISYNPSYGVVISIDKAGILEYWTGLKDNFKFPSKIVSFDSKLDTGMLNILQFHLRLNGVPIITFFFYRSIRICKE